MILECPAKALLAAVKTCQPAVAGRTGRAVLRCVKIEVAGASAFVSANNLELGVRAAVVGYEAEGPGDMGDVVVSPDRLVPILAEAGGDMVRLTVDATGETLTVRHGRSRFQLPAYPADEFPDVAEFDMDTPHVIVSAGTFRRLIGRTEFAVAKSDVRTFSTTGVLFECGLGGQIKLVATDTKRMAVVESIHGERTTVVPTRIVPAAAVRLLGRVDSADDGDPVRIAIAETDVRVACGPAVVTTRVVEGRFPPYDKIIPKAGPIRLTLPAAEFLNRVRQAAITTDDETKRVDCRFEPGKLTMFARSVAGGASEVFLDLPDFGGPDVAISFDPAFLTDMLRAIGNVPSVDLELTNGEKPAVFRVGDDYLYLLMPLVG